MCAEIAGLPRCTSTLNFSIRDISTSLLNILFHRPFFFGILGGKPQILTKSGNLVLVAADGKEVGYQTSSGETINFSDLPTRLQTYTHTENQALIDALQLGYQLGEVAAQTAAQTSGTTSVMDYFKTSVKDDIASLKEGLASVENDVDSAVEDVDSAVKGMDLKVAAVDAKIASVGTTAAKAATDAVAGPLKKAAADIVKLEQALEAVTASASKAGKVGDHTKVKCASDGDLGNLGYDLKTGVVMVCHKAKVGGKTTYLMNNVGTKYMSGGKFTSFGVVSAANQCKSPRFTKYTGDQPTGTRKDQYNKVQCTGCSRRPGGMSYTDLVMQGDFTIIFHQYDGGSGDGYNMWSFFPEGYNGYTHANLRSWGNENFWGVYSNPGCKYDVSWDGSARNEGRKRIGRFCDTTRYVGFQRKSGYLSLYESKTPPGDAGVGAMTKRHTWSSKNTDPLRLGLFMHDNSDWIEVYTPGTSVNIKGK